MTVVIKEKIYNIFGLLFFWILLVTAIHCRKNNSANTNLPDITQNGSNTFGCKLNGQILVPNAACSYLGDPCAGMDVTVFRAKASDSLPVEITISVAQRNAGVTNYIQMVSKKIIEPTGPFIYSTGNIYDSLRINYTNPNGRQYFTIDGMPGNVILTKLDLKNHIIAGVFNFTLYVPGDSVVVSEGRFDLNFNVCKCF